VQSRREKLGATDHALSMTPTADIMSAIKIALQYARPAGNLTPVSILF
jgi:hypothetical protein